MVSRLPAKGPVDGAGVGACAAALPAASSAHSAMASFPLMSRPSPSCSVLRRGMVPRTCPRSGGLLVFQLGERFLQRRFGRRDVPDGLDAFAVDARAVRLDIEQGGASR